MSELSESDRTILQMTADGSPLNDIASAVKLAEGTVRQHRFKLMQLLGAENLNNLIARAMRRKLIE